MNFLKKTRVIVAAMFAVGAPVAAVAQSHGKVLVVVSGAHLLNLRDGKVYSTGYYLNELATPLEAIIKAGYTPVFANPNGDTPSMDGNSDNVKFFGGDDARRMSTLKFIDGLPGLRHPMKLSEVSAHTKEYVGIFVPGGHAPMVDLVKDKDLGKILRSFHKSGKPTGLICHGPMALLSTLPDAEKFDQALISGDSASLQALAHGWPYAGYRVTVFSKSEEQQVEAGQLDGRIQYYNDDGLAAAGAQVTNGADWKSNVIEDRELVTGEQPFSDEEFATAFIAKLNAHTR